MTNKQINKETKKQRNVDITPRKIYIGNMTNHMHGFENNNNGRYNYNNNQRYYNNNNNSNSNRNDGRQGQGQQGQVSAYVPDRLKMHELYEDTMNDNSNNNNNNNNNENNNECDDMYDGHTGATPEPTYPNHKISRQFMPNKDENKVFVGGFTRGYKTENFIEFCQINRLSVLNEPVIQHQPGLLNLGHFFFVCLDG